jgi:hypothetical protein
MHADARKLPMVDGLSGNGWVMIRVVVEGLRLVAKVADARRWVRESEREKKKAPALESVRALSV